MVLERGNLTKTAVRLDAVERLKGKTLAGANVFSGKAVHQADSVAYAINVNTPSGAQTPKSVNEYRYTQSINLVVSCFVAILPDDPAGLQGVDADEELSRRLDQMEEEVYAALFQDPEWRDTWLTPPSVSVTQERTVAVKVRTGVVHLTITCEDSRRWRRDFSDAGVLDSVNVSVEPLGADGAPIPDLPPIQFTESPEDP